MKKTFSILALLLVTFVLVLTTCIYFWKLTSDCIENLRLLDIYGSNTINEPYIKEYTEKLHEYLPYAILTTLSLIAVIATTTLTIIKDFQAFKQIKNNFHKTTEQKK